MPEPTGKVQATIEAISSVLPGGRISVSARQDRHLGEIGPSWTIHVAGTQAGSAFSLELGWGSAFSFPIGAGLGVASWLLIFVRILRRGGEKLSGRAQERIRVAMIAFVLVVALWFAYEAAVAYAG